MNRFVSVCTLVGLLPLSAVAQDSYIAFDSNSNMVLSGPFDLHIPRPGNTTPAGPEDSRTSLLDEELRVSRAGYFGADQFILVEIETTSAGAGTLSADYLPTLKVGDEEFLGRKLCVDVGAGDLEGTDDPLFEFILAQDVKIVPAVLAMQLVATGGAGSALGTIIFVRNVPGGCEAMTPEFEDKFTADFERYVRTVRDAN
jgi:hypothetical protein